MMRRTVWASLVDRSQQFPHHPFICTRDASLSYGDTVRAVEARAAGLTRLGIRPGHRGLIAMRNCADHALTWLALNAIGAAAVPVNPALSDTQLQHQFRIADARILVADDDHAEQLHRISMGHGLLVKAARTTHGNALPKQWTTLDRIDRSSESGTGDLDQASPETLGMVLFTSGTTGPPKGCRLSNHYLVRQGELLAKHMQLRQTDVLYCPFPMFHADAISYTVMAAIATGATAAIGERYSTSRFWDDINFFGATVFDFMGATLTMLYQVPERPDDHKNPVRLAWGVPVPPFADDFERRFGLQIVTAYGSTDVGVPIVQPHDRPRRPGSCGRPVDEYAVRVVDADARPVDPDEVGELEVQAHEPNLMSDGYLGMPEETTRSRRDGWFRTGDLVRRDVDGWIYFVGRSGDVLRRRGENLSALDIEAAVNRHPAVGECAAYGVPSPLTEDDVMLAYTTLEGVECSPADLAAFCTSTLPAHMVPRYFRRMDHLPHTSTEKVAKTSLIADAVTLTTWDRESTSVTTAP